MTNNQVISRLWRALVHNPTARVTLPAIFPKNIKIEWRNKTLRCSVRARSALCNSDRTFQRESRPLVSLLFKDVEPGYIWRHVARSGFCSLGFLFISAECPKTSVVLCRVTIHCELRKSNSLPVNNAFHFCRTTTANRNLKAAAR